ncbi:MAG TPA: hypothetical protein VJR46_12300 [Candidatus Dormibacteraeota bacterium]|nr:hypothetical protein [Candidatus Dormibacteraeota bacterium]
MKRWLLALAVLSACSSAPPPEFSLTGARVDATHWCPGGSVDARYDVHATIEARNTTKKDVTIESATAEMVLVSVSGAWIEKVGDRYDAGAVVVSPSTIAAGSTTKLDLTIPSSCTSGLYGSSQSSSGSYTVTVHLVTSAGTFTIAAGNRHQILAA